ncbi:MAG: glycosyltransferase [Thermodesulfobacteriota bacterium]|jgi:cellulose synthase/poly-beta-1,6-N-acetylglucosamine synthase-like glycosyltransferase
MKNLLYQKVFRWWDYPLFTVFTVANGSIVGWFLWHWFSLADWPTYKWIYVTLTLLLGIVWINYCGRWFLLPRMRKPGPVAAPPGLRVAVVTTFVPDAEPLAMLAHTVRALVSLDYPHDTWVLDEGDDERVKTMCQTLGAHHFSRKHLPQYQTEQGVFQSHSKHGNYNAWLYEIGFERYEIVSAFDPDHVPQKDFLDNVLGYFTDPQIGYVQVAPAYYNQEASFIARGAAEETYSYFSAIQMAAHALGHPIIIGSHNTHGVQALKEVGGFAPHDADDLLITLRYRAQGWQGVYVPKVLACGLAPVDWTGYVGQQRRWARSVLDIKIRQYFRYAAGLPWPSRILGFLHGFNYLHRSVVIVTALLLLVVLLAAGFSPMAFSGETVWRLLVVSLVLQGAEFYRQRFFLNWRQEWGWHWRAGLLQFAIWPYFLAALFEVLCGRAKEYVLTKKVKTKSNSCWLFWPQALVAALVGTAWTYGAVTHESLNPYLQLMAGTVIVGSLALVLSARMMSFPSPFDEQILQRFLMRQAIVEIRESHNSSPSLAERGGTQRYESPSF